MYEYIKIEKLKLDSKKRLDRTFIKQGDYTFCVYLIYINDSLVYIGKCRDMWKRLDTYRNSKYWFNANPSNVLKTSRIEMALKKNKTVEFKIIKSTESDYDELEEKLIRRHLPAWNKKLCYPKSS